MSEPSVEVDWRKALDEAQESANEHQDRMNEAQRRAWGFDSELQESPDL